jgi:hypothetical protein
VIEVRIAPRAGLWCPLLSGWEAFRAALVAGVPDASGAAPEPFPTLLPGREGRRAPLHVRLALEAAQQACATNAVDPAAPLTVFASGMGDAEITDYLCRTLAEAAPLVSPTRFHNSVHNAASGYWAIATGNHGGSTSVAAGDCTFPVALLEAAALAAAEDAVVLLVLHDVAVPRPLEPVCRNRQPFAAALLLAPAGLRPDWAPLRLEVSVSAVAGAAAWPASGAPWLRRLAEENQSARVLDLLVALAGSAPAALEFPLEYGGRVGVAIGGNSGDS